MCARRLLVRYGVQMALRTLDALQLAFALELRRAGLISIMVSSDLKLCRVAEASGCSAVNPCDPGLSRL